MRTFNCAIVGCGNVAGGYGEDGLTHAGAYKLCPKTKLIGASDISPKALKDFGDRWGVNRLYRDYRRMLESEDIDILSICLPAEKHYDVFKLACEKNIPAIFCEKPFSLDLEEARNMVRISRNKIVAINYFRRWNKSLSRLRDEINDGIYGKVINIVARYTKGIFVNGSHLIDLMLWFFGEPVSVRALKINDVDAKDPGVDFVMNFKNGLRAYFINIPQAQYVFIDIDILTSAGRISISQRGQTIERYEIMDEPHYKKFDILKKVEAKQTEWRSCLRGAVSEIADALDKGDKISCTPEDGLKVLEVCYKAIGRRK